MMMTTNPFVHVFASPVESLTAGAYALVLTAALVASWYALGRNLLYLAEQWQEGWLVLVPFWYAARVVGLLLLVALDLLLVAGIIGVLT
jgi:hypothetical protein